MNGLQNYDETNMVFIFGGTGNLGKSLINNLPPSFKVIEVPRSIYELWWNEGTFLEIEDYFMQYTNRNRKNLAIFALGVVQKESPDQLLKANFLIPKNVLTALTDWNVHSATIGSVHEDFEIENLYLDSKRKLVEWIISNQIHTNYHFKLHTLYGGHRIDSRMLLSQILESLQNRTIFELNDGSQMREYHHVKDISMNIWKLISENSPGIIEISAGESLLLSDLTRDIFEKYDKKELLEVLSFNAPTFETQSMYSFTRKNCFFYRNPMSGVIQWMDTILKYD